MTLTAEIDPQATLVATWPAAEQRRFGPFLLHLSPGGGKRVQAAVLDSTAWSEQDLTGAEAEMQAQGKPALFRLSAGQSEFDAALAARGYGLVDTSLILAGPLAPLCEIPIPPVTAFEIWPPLAIQTEIWTACGIGPDRQAVMDRVQTPCTSVLGRKADKPAGSSFVAIHGPIAMCHALEVLPEFRRKGLARQMMARAARWAATQGCTQIAVAVVAENAPARALYDRLGLTVVAEYHYRRKEAA